MILISPELLINYIYFKKRKVNLSVQLTILFGLKRFVGTDTLAKIASEAAAKSISEVKAVDIPEKNSSSSSFDGFSSQQLTTPGTDPTLPSNTHYVITNEKKKDVQEQHKQMQKQDYTAQASLKKAEEHKKLQEDQGSFSVDNKPNITIGAGVGAGAGIISALEHHKKNLQSNNSKINDPQNTVHSITPAQQPTTSHKAEGKLIDQDVTEAKTNDSKIIDKSSTDQHLPNQPIAETIPDEQKNKDSNPADKENQDKPITDTKITEQKMPEEKNNDKPITDTKTTKQDPSDTTKPESPVIEANITSHSNKEDKDNQEPPKSDQSILAQKKDEIDNKALEEKVREEQELKKALEQLKQLLEEHKKNFKKVLDNIEELGKNANNNNNNNNNDNNNNDSNNNDNNDNIKPDKIPSNMKGFYKSQSGKQYTTEITVETTPDNISDTDLIEEMKKRELIKNDPGNTSTTFKTKNNEEVIVGSSKNKIKLTQLGQSYSQKTMINNPVTEKIGPDVEYKEIKYEDFCIITPPPVNEETFIETGLQKHLLAAFDSQFNTYVGVCYLTSKITGTKLCDKQFKIFQKEQENPGKEFPNTKIQYIGILPTPVVIKKEDGISVVSLDKEYLQSIPTETRDDLLERVNELIKNLPQQFNKSGITKQDCINMCREHDNTLLKKGKHPLTPDQIKQNEENKNKQQEKNKTITIKQKLSSEKTD